MNITLISTTFPHPRAGVQVGIERHAREYALTLVKKGHRVKVLTTFWNGGKYSQENYKGIELYRFPDSSYKYGKLGRQFDLQHITFSKSILRNANVLKDSDVVHAIGPVYITEYLQKHHVPLITHFHHLEKIRRPVEILKYPFTLRNQKKVYFNSDIIVTMTQNNKRELIRYYGIPEGQIRIVPHGVHLEQYKSRNKTAGASSTLKLLYVGSLEKRKGLRYLIEALRITKSKDLHITCTLVGRGEDRKTLENLVNKYNLTEVVTFKGFIPDKQLIEEYAQADVFILPSLQEGFGIPLIEAMASGLAIISTNTSSIPEVVGDAGILVEPKNSEELAKAILMVIENESLRKDLVKRGNERVLRLFTWDRVVEQLLGIYCEIIMRKKHH